MHHIGVALGTEDKHAPDGAQLPGQAALAGQYQLIPAGFSAQQFGQFVLEPVI